MRRRVSAQPDAYKYSQSSQGKGYGNNETNRCQCLHGMRLVRVFLPRFDTRILFAVCVIVAGAILILKKD